MLAMNERIDRQCLLFIELDDTNFLSAPGASFTVVKPSPLEHSTGLHLGSAKQLVQNVFDLAFGHNYLEKDGLGIWSIGQWYTNLRRETIATGPMTT